MEYTGTVPISPQGINPNVAPTCYFNKNPFYHEIKCPGTSLTFILWSLLMVNQTLKERKNIDISILTIEAIQ